MLLAEESTDGRMAMITVLAGLLGGAAVWVWNALGSKRKTTITEWMAISDAKDARANQMQVQMNELALRASRSEVAEARCQGELGQVRTEMNYLQDQFRRLQAKIGDLPPGVTPPTEIICDVNGFIRWASASCGSMFHYLPQELIGKNVSILMPVEMRPLHKRAMELMVSEKRLPDPAKAIRSFAITKDGRKFPVSINLSGWEAEPGKMFVNAEIRSAGDSDLFNLATAASTTTNTTTPEPSK